MLSTAGADDATARAPDVPWPTQRSLAPRRCSRVPAAVPAAGPVRWADAPSPPPPLPGARRRAAPANRNAGWGEAAQAATDAADGIADEEETLLRGTLIFISL